jgi:hypothetical protein
MKKPKYVVSYVYYGVMGRTETITSFYTKREMDRYLKFAKAKDARISVAPKASRPKLRLQK